MSKITELTLTKIVNGIKKKEFTSLEVTNNLLHVSGKNRLLTDECQYI